MPQWSGALKPACVAPQEALEEPDAARRKQEYTRGQGTIASKRASDESESCHLKYEAHERVCEAQLEDLRSRSNTSLTRRLRRMLEIQFAYHTASGARLKRALAALDDPT